MRSPAWTREEVILALDLYKRFYPRIPGPATPEVVEVSRILNQIDIHPAHLRPEDFRSPKAVSLKLSNLRSLDPTTESEGLKATSKIDREVWDELAGNPAALADAVRDIRSMI